MVKRTTLTALVALFATDVQAACHTWDLRSYKGSSVYDGDTSIFR